MSEIKPPKAEVVRLPTAFNGRVSDINSLKASCLALANDIENLKGLTPWPRWSQCQADSLRDYANDLPEDSSGA